MNKENPIDNLYMWCFPKSGSQTDKQYLLYILNTLENCVSYWKKEFEKSHEMNVAQHLCNDLSTQFIPLLQKYSKK